MPAQTYYWTDDDGDGDFENPTGTNWRTAAGVAAGAGVYPGSAQADNVVFPSYAAGAPSVNVDQSANANGITNVTVEAGYAYAAGTREAPLYLKVAGAATWTFKGSSHGDIWIVSGTAAITALNILKTASSSDALHLAFSHAVTTANVTGGNIWFDDALFGVSSVGEATLNVSTQSGGSQPNLRVFAPVTTVLNNYGGKVYWNAGTVTAFNQYEGTFTCEESVTARTLTASACYGGTVDLRTGIPGTITLTAPIAYKGGSIYFDVGENLQRS